MTRKTGAGTGLHFAAVVAMALGLALTAGGCPCVDSVVNASPGLRWFLFSNFGASKVCPEMMKTSVPLKLSQNTATIGRFFPSSCSVTTDGNTQTMQVTMSGTGYGFMLPAKRVGFQLSTTVEYRPDFRLAGDDVYVWGRFNRTVTPPNFQLGYVENAMINAATYVPGVGTLANMFGGLVVSATLMGGFTVIHNEDKGNDFSLGHLEPPLRPRKPYDVTASNRLTYTNEAIDLQVGQRDYLGPYEIVEQGQSLFTTFTVSGSPIEAIVVQRTTGDIWRDQYQHGQLTPVPGPTTAGQQLPMGRTTQQYRLAPGSYYIVLDHTAQAGMVVPPPFSLTGTRVDALVQLGE